MGGIHIFLPLFTHITPIIQPGWNSPCIIEIIFRELRSKYIRIQLIDFNTRTLPRIVLNFYCQAEKL